MKTSLDHLPLKKQRELQNVLDVLFEEIEQENQLKSHEWKRCRRIQKVILFGSYARGDWVQGHQISGYQSDYDLLIIVSHHGLVMDQDFVYRAGERLMHAIKTPVSFIVHTLADVNDSLVRGQFFFTDIKRDGVALFEACGRKPLAEPGNLSPETALDVADEHYEKWMKNAEGFRKAAQLLITEGILNIAAFQLHQVAECLYATNLLVLTNYMPNTHNIRHLRSLTESQDARFIAAFPRSLRSHKRNFELLKDAYVKARYSKEYKINEEQLTWLKKCVEELRALTEKICRERIKELAKKAGK